jgi:opacity protein-like surface antigen
MPQSCQRWTAGVGLEHRFRPQLSGIVSYEYSDYDSANVAGTPRVSGLELDAIAQSVRLAIHVRF